MSSKFIGRKIVVLQDLDSSPYESLESRVNTSLQDSEREDQVDPKKLNLRENVTPKSPDATLLHPTLPNHKERALLRDGNDGDHQKIRTALSLLGYKLTGNVVLGADVDNLARSIVGHMEGTGEHLIRVALSTLGARMTGKKEDVRDLANRIIGEKEDVRDLANRIAGEGRSSWASSSSPHQESVYPAVNSPLPVITEATHNSQTFDTDPLTQKLTDSGYGTPRAATQAAVLDSNALTSDPSSGPLAWFEQSWLPPPGPIAYATSLLKCPVCQKHVKSRSELK